jgi:hypothetical protein
MFGKIYVSHCTGCCYHENPLGLIPPNQVGVHSTFGGGVVVLSDLHRKLPEGPLLSVRILV